MLIPINNCSLPFALSLWSQHVKNGTLFLTTKTMTDMLIIFIVIHSSVTCNRWLYDFNYNLVKNEQTNVYYSLNLYIHTVISVATIMSSLE